MDFDEQLTREKVETLKQQLATLVRLIRGLLMNIKKYRNGMRF